MSQEGIDIEDLVGEVKTTLARENNPKTGQWKELLLVSNVDEKGTISCSYGFASDKNDGITRAVNANIVINSYNNYKI